MKAGLSVTDTPDKAYCVVAAGIVYLTLKAASFLVGVLMGVPLIASLVGTVTSALGL